MVLDTGLWGIVAIRITWERRHGGLVLGSLPSLSGYMLGGWLLNTGVLLHVTHFNDGGKDEEQPNREETRGVLGVQDVTPCWIPTPWW